MDFVNARIKSTMLGVEDHGILTCMLHLDFGGGGVGYGGFGMDEPIKVDGEFKGRRGVAYGAECIRKILDILEVGRWEDLPGKLIRFRPYPMLGGHSGDCEIGHPLKDQWFSFKKLAQEMNIRSD